ncbi:diguanylate cyclase [Teredinibacter haidensis]|uniref:diguanylate cyclase n=1 Tax=Teredinibacter haidensis TaxID=2731755 RepID=UPI001115088C|nr:diguanylate cyclase [Teredinibacter haidensis]
MNFCLTPLLVRLAAISIALASPFVLSQEQNPTKTLNISYPEDIGVSNNRLDNGRYVREILILGLKHSGRTYKLNAQEVRSIPESRSHLYLEQGRYNLHWLMTSADHENDLLPVRIPIYKGLIGWRLFFIKPENQPFFSSITVNSKLKNVHACLGHDWPDVDILEAGGYKVITNIAGLGIFETLNKSRCQYYPRSVLEIWNEIENAHHYGASAETELALRYPAAYYFFVSPDEKDLAIALENGLKRAIALGEFDQIFYRHFGDAIEKSNLGKRRIFSIPNALFKNTAVLSNKNLWFTPQGKK